MSRGVLIAILVSSSSTAGAVWSFTQASKLTSDGKWLMARGDAQAAEYANTFDGSIADAQLALFEQRREVLEQAQKWQRSEMLLILVAVVSAFCAYVLYLFGRLRQQLADASATLPEEDVLLPRAAG